MQTSIQPIYRNEQIAKREAAVGMHHAGFWECCIARALNALGAQYGHVRLNGDGSHMGLFIDPTTGITYELTIKPRG